MYTVRSESPEGVYYLVCNWRKNKTFWVKQEELKSYMLFKTAAGARRSLTCLLKIMPDYSNDIFTLVEV